MKMPYSAVSAFLPALLFFSSCKHTAEADTLFKLMDNTGIDFNNKVIDGKTENSFLFRNFYNGGGVAIGDINNDGLSDVFMTSNMGDNKLYLNKGSFKFDDITAKAGIRQDSAWCTGVTFADINNDGWLDMYVCSSGHMGTGRRKNKLYINNRNSTFTESAAAYGLDIVGYSTQVSFFDYDMDGDLDMFLINNSPIPVNQLGYANRRDLPEAQWPVAAFLKGGGDHLYNNNNGHFTEVTKQAGIHGSLISFGLGVSVADINGDNWPDVYVSNDSYERDYLYINQKDGTFRDELEDMAQHTSFSSMGTDIVDINNDGLPDMFTTDMLPYDDYRLKTTGAFDNIDLYRSKVKSGFYHQFVQNCLQLNNGAGHFYDIAFYGGVQATDWSWGALMFDADNDGWNDLYVCNGVNRDVTNLDFMDFFANDLVQKMVLTGNRESLDQVVKKIPRTPLPNKVFKNNGNLTFTETGNAWGLNQPSFSNGAAYGDLDNDGDLDLIVSNINQPAFVYCNKSVEQKKINYISILLKGEAKNTFAIGSKIYVYSGTQILTREIIPSRGFQSSVDYKAVIGLGSNTHVDSMTVIWPNRTYSTYYHPALNRLHVLQQPATAQALKVPDKHKAPVFEAVKTSFDRHREDDYIDFYQEREVPEMLSRQGPAAAVSDVNADGLDDIYICGAAGQGGQLYIQNQAGSFVKKPEKAFEQFADFEDVSALFFDCDGDGDVDLFVGSGGNNHSAGSRELQNRLYKNDGKGNFTIDADALPNSGMNNGVVIAGDFDKDGDLDLFVGGRSMPMIYGVTPDSYILMNNGSGKYVDIAASRNKDIAAIGMVTGAVWEDVTGDGNKDLVIAGEWMAPRVFSFKTDRFTEIKTDLNNLYGWWQTVASADVNNDGKPDLILGNVGENFYLRPDKDHPVKIWISDFDHNGSIDKVLTRTINGKDMPVFLKRDMEDQLPVLKKLALKHQDFGLKSIQQLLPEELQNSKVKLFNYPGSCVAINRGNGKFTVQPLPSYAQFSSVNAIMCKDINGDGTPDLVMGGNNFSFLPQFCRLDASYGYVLTNDGKGNFTWLSPAASGLQLRGVIRDIREVRENASDNLLFLQNDDYPVIYKIASSGKPDGKLKLSSKVTLKKEQAAYSFLPKKRSNNQ